MTSGLLLPLKSDCSFLGSGHFRFSTITKFPVVSLGVCLIATAGEEPRADSSGSAVNSWLCYWLCNTWMRDAKEQQLLCFLSYFLWCSSVHFSLCRVGRERDAHALYLGLRYSLERVEPWQHQDFIPPLCPSVWVCLSPQWDNWCPWTRWKQLSFLFGYWIICFVFFWVIIYEDSELNWLIESNDRHPEGNWLPS